MRKLRQTMGRSPQRQWQNTRRSTIVQLQNYSTYKESGGHPNLQYEWLANTSTQYIRSPFFLGALAKKIYHHDSTSNLFQKTPDPNSTKVRFELALNKLTRVDPTKRSIITRVVNLLKSPPYNLENPTMCFHDTAV